MRPEEKARTSQHKALTHNGELKLIVRDNEVYCTKCNFLLGTVHNHRNFLTGGVIIVNRAAVRCYVCFERHVWTPLDGTLPERGREL